MKTATRTPWVTRDIKHVLELVAQGLTYEAIGEHLGRTRFSVEGLIRDLRTRRAHSAFWDLFDSALAERDRQILNGAQRFRWSIDLDTLLMRLTREGRPDVDISQQLGVSRSAVKMRRFKIKDRALVDAPSTFDDPVLALAISGSWRRAA